MVWVDLVEEVVQVGIGGFNAEGLHDGADESWEFSSLDSSVSVNISFGEQGGLSADESFSVVTTGLEFAEVGQMLLEVFNAGVGNDWGFHLSVSLIKLIMDLSM